MAKYVFERWDGLGSWETALPSVRADYCENARDLLDVVDGK